MVKCADCGFLALRNQFTGQLDEGDEDYRRTGMPPLRKKSNQPGGPRSFLDNPYDFPFANPPICFVQAFNLGDEFSVEPSQILPEMALDVLKNERDCGERELFTSWQQGFTPKEHREMLDRQRRLQQEEDIRRAIWAREDARDKAQAAAHSEEMETLKQQHRAQLLVFGGLIGAATVAAGILDGLVSRGVDVWPF
jgi:hypothetical protein